MYDLALHGSAVPLHVCPALTEGVQTDQVDVHGGAVRWRATAPRPLRIMLVGGDGHHLSRHLLVTLPIQLFKAQVTLTEAPLTVRVGWTASQADLPG